jgi:hypothetical protein
MAGLAAAAAVVLAGLSATPAQAADTGPQVTPDAALHLSPGTVSNTSDYPKVKVFAKWRQFDTSGISSEYGYVYSYDRFGNQVDYIYFSGVRTKISFSSQVGGWAELYLYATNGNGVQSSTSQYYSAPGLVQENAATYNAGWTTGSCLCWSGGAILKSNAAGQTATYKFYGNQVGLLSEKRPGGGTAELFLDGTKVASFNSAGDVPLLVVPAKYRARYAQHTLQVKVTSGRIDVDGFVTTG